MSAKRARNVMLRLTDDEFERLTAARPDGEDLAVFARRTLLAAVAGARPPDVRRAAAFVVAALSADIDFAEALALFDDHTTTTEGA